MSVSVVIPSRDRWPLLSRAVRGALAQEGVELEVIVIDDGSREPLEPQLAGLGDERVRVLRHPTSLGVARARNRAVEAARAPWVAFLDDDDQWAPEHLARLAAVAGDDVAFAFSRHYLIDEQGVVVGRGPDPVGKEMLGQLVAGNPVVTPSAVLARRELVQEVGGFDPAFSILADWDLWLRLAQRGRVAVSGALSVAYLQHSQSMHRDAKGILSEHGALAIKHAELLRRHRSGLGDPLFFQWVASGVAPTRQRRLGARWYVAHQRRFASLPRIAAGLVRMARSPAIQRGAERRPLTPQPRLEWAQTGS
jgi:glycosyltransferase involved in cell wall biosynthesis